MSLSCYMIIKKIGQGTFGEVLLVENKIKKKCVLKKISLKNAQETEKTSARSECEFLKKLNHPNIVQYYDSFEENDSLYIVMSYCEGGDLYSKLKERNGRYLSEKQILEWFIQIVMALSYIHSKNILHRDLKTQNIFLAKSSVIKVGDLGIAKQLQNKNDMTSTMIGTPFYMSPELCSKQSYNYKSDIWSLGCITYEMVTLKHAFNANDFDALSSKIINGQTPNMPSNYSRDLIDLIKSMLSKQPDYRPSTNKILRSPFIQQHIKDFLNNIKRKKSSSPTGQPILHRSKTDSAVGKSQSNKNSPEKLADKFIHDCRVSSSQSNNLLNCKPKNDGNEHDIDNSSSQLVGGNHPRRPSRTVMEEQMEKIIIAEENKNQEIISPLLSWKENNHERQSARDRRREKNRNQGLTTMLFTCDDDFSDENKGDDSEKHDTNRLSARDRRRNSSENEQNVILPQLRRKSDEDNVDLGARDELMDVMKRMSETLNVENKETNDRAMKSSPSCRGDDDCQERTTAHDEARLAIRKYVHVS